MIDIHFGHVVIRSNNKIHISRKTCAQHKMRKRDARGCKTVPTVHNDQQTGDLLSRVLPFRIVFVVAPKLSVRPRVVLDELYQLKALALVIKYGSVCGPLCSSIFPPRVCSSLLFGCRDHLPLVRNGESSWTEPYLQAWRERLCQMGKKRGASSALH